MKVVILSGAGMSAESGLKTFRDSNGLWEGHDVMEVASPQGFRNNPQIVLDFYNQRRRQLQQVQPNQAHIDIADLEKDHEVIVITQNVDDLHERAGSSHVVHLHGELLKVRSSYDENSILDWRTDLNIGDTCERGYQLRPHIVWFGEPVPMMNVAINWVSKADAIIIVGTSMQVYPAYAKNNITIYFVDPNPSIRSSDNIIVFSEKATTGIPKVVRLL